MRSQSGSHTPFKVIFAQEMDALVSGVRDLVCSLSTSCQPIYGLAENNHGISSRDCIYLIFSNIGLPNARKCFCHQLVISAIVHSNLREWNAKVRGARDKGYILIFCAAEVGGGGGVSYLCCPSAHCDAVIIVLHLKVHSCITEPSQSGSARRHADDVRMQKTSTSHVEHVGKDPYDHEVAYILEQRPRYAKKKPDLLGWSSRPCWWARAQQPGHNAAA